MNWSDEATELFADLVVFLPTSMRPRVEEQAETCAEVMAMQTGREEIVPEFALCALLECTPMHMRGRLLEAMECRNALRAGE